MKEQITVVVTRVVYTANNFLVEFRSRADGVWYVTWEQTISGSGPRQAAIKASAKLAARYPSREFYFNDEKVYESQAVSAFAEAETVEAANHVYYTPEYRALERRYEEALEQTRVALRRTEKAETEASRLRESEKTWTQHARAKLERVEDDNAVLQLRNGALEEAVRRQADALHKTNAGPLQVKTCTLNSKTNRVIVQLRRADNNEWIYSTEHMSTLDEALMRAIEEARSRGFVIVGETSDRSTYGDASLIREHRENKRQLDLYLNELASLKVKLRDLSR